MSVARLMRDVVQRIEAGGRNRIVSAITQISGLYIDKREYQVRIHEDKIHTKSNLEPSMLMLEFMTIWS